MKTLITLLILFIATPVFAGINFDGTDDRITLGVNAIGPCVDGASAVTMYVFFEVDAFPPNDDSDIILDVSIDGDSTGLSMAMRDDSGVDQLRVAGRSRSADSFQQHKTAYNTLNTPVVFIGVMDFPEDEIRSYIDGVEDSDSVTFGATSYTNDTPTGVDTIGMLIGVSNFSNVTIYEMAIWKSELTQAEIDLLSNAKVKGLVYQIQPSNLIAYWQLNEVADGASGDGVTFVDRSGTGNDGTGNDGAGNANLTGVAEKTQSYP